MAHGLDRLTLAAGLVGASILGGGLYKFVKWKLEPDEIMVTYYDSDGTVSKRMQRNVNKYRWNDRTGKNKDSFVLLLFDKSRLFGFPILSGIMTGRR